MDALAYDFAIFWEGAGAVLSGQSPYSIPGYYPIPPFAIATAPIGLLPRTPAFILWSVVNIAALASIARRKTPIALLYLPVFFGIWVGQVDLIILALGFTGSWIGVALTALKPQLAVWLIPFYVIAWSRSGQTRRLIPAMAAVTAIYGIPTILWPSWWAQWTAATPSMLEYAQHASSAFGLSALLQELLPPQLSILLVAILGAAIFSVVRPWTDSRYWSWAAIFNPLANIYSLCIVLQEADWISYALSWLLLPVALYLHTGFPWVLVPVYLLWKQRKAAKV